VLRGVVLCSVRTVGIVGIVRNVGAVVIADIVAVPLSTSSLSEDEW
jgi:ABC-type sulfate transport system permease subunit